MSKDFNRSIENDPCIFWAWFQSLRDFINNKFIVDDVQFPVYETRPVYKNNNWTEEEFVYFPVSLFQIAFYLDDEERQILKKLICDMDAQIPKRKFTETSAERQKEWINKMDIAEKNALNLIPPSNSSKPETKIPVAYFTQIESRAQQFKRYGLGASSALITAVKFVADEEQIDLSPILHFVNFIGDFIKQEQEEDEENFIERMLQNE